VRNIKYNLQKKNAGTLPSASVQHAFDALGKIKITAPAKLKGKAFFICSISGIKIDYIYIH